MPLRQSTLNFGFKASTTSLTALPPILSSTNLPLSASASVTDVDTDTIVVDISEASAQLPTPADSATDVSSQDGHAETRGRSHRQPPKRVAGTRKSRFREAACEPAEGDAAGKNRSISGETLVNSASQSSLLRNSIEALDLPWTMNEIFVKGTKSTSLPVVVEGNAVQHEDDLEKAEKAAARKLKKAENAQKWEERKSLADKNATRKSSRSSMFEKAGNIITEASTVLGKRSRDIVEKGVNKLNELRSGVQSEAAHTSTEGRAPKRIQLSPDAHLSTVHKGKRVKRWLASGLYAGQARSYDPRLSESANKRKGDKSIDAAKENSTLPLPMFAGDRLLKWGRDFTLPWDVYAPPPPGKAKPDGWKKCNKNVFVGDAADVWRANKMAEHSTCYCRPEIGCDQDCINRYMYYECDSNNCNLTYEQCGNRQWEQLRLRNKCGNAYSVGVDVVKTEDRGHGVRASRTFAPNQLIVEYAGEIITQEECEHRMRTIYKDNECYYLMLFDQNMILDATRGSVARFVNHSCEPNCRMEKWTVDGKPRMALFAGDAGIMTGEELTYDYNFDPYSQKNVQECRCGTRACRGILGPKPKDVKQKSPDTDIHSKKAEGRFAGAKRKVADAIEEGTNRLTKKRKVAPVTTLVKKAAGKPAPKPKSPRKVVVVKKVTARKVSMPKTTVKAPTRKPTKLKKMVSKAKGKAVKASGKRVASTTSATEALIKSPGKKSSKDQKVAAKKKASLGRSSSLKEKAASLKRSVVRSVAGRGSSRSTIVVKS